MMKKHDYSIEEKKKAAYALNMCTVSVSQILDYNDVYVLEQEYDAILNNLNLEEIPKDEKETLLNILQEILNVISFFRIQKTRRDQNEKKYQQRMKNAIWHAIPSFNMMIAPSGSLRAKNAASAGARGAKSALGTGPAMAAWSIATQIGTAYMSYRREKAAAAQEKEDSEIELEIAAIEQLHALQRELFTTAWRMADEYGYPDQWRLTEKQIEHYNQVLMDSNDIRKYARLEAMQKNFAAYPAFWYNFAHTALYIATTFKDEATKGYYLEKAEENFQKYREINAFNLLREDQITASANLEYADLLLQKPNPDLEEINSLIAGAEEKAGGALDVLQLCAIAYLRTGETPAAERLFKILVNEDYNAVTNAQLLSRLYVKTYIYTGDMSQKVGALRDYRLLETQIGSDHLFPMPSQVKCPGEKSPEEKFLATQKALLEKMYRLSINAYEEQQARMFCTALPAPEQGECKEENYYAPGVKAQQQRLRDAELALAGRSAADYIAQLSESNFRYRYIDVLNRMIAGMEELACFRNLANHDDLISLPAQKLEEARGRPARTAKENGRWQLYIR